VAVFFISGSNCLAAEATVVWDPNVEPQLAGYRLYYGTVSGNYSYTVDVGNITQFTLTMLAEDVLYYITATAYDELGNESGFSNEITWIALSTPLPPLPPTNGIINYELIEIKKLKKPKFTILPDGSIMYILPDAQPGDTFIWSY
jgi:hypothetical protein